MVCGLDTELPGLLIFSRGGPWHYTMTSGRLWGAHAFKRHHILKTLHDQTYGKKCRMERKEVQIQYQQNLSILQMFFQT